MLTSDADSDADSVVKYYKAAVEKLFLFLVACMTAKSASESASEVSIRYQNPIITHTGSSS